MGKGRLEALSDGVIAIIITIMVLELRAPQDASFSALAPLWPAFLSYVLSFVYLGIYWNNHHHLLHAVKRVSGMTLWANLHLLFWLSLIPFVTRWMGETHFAAWPVMAYGGVLLMCSLSWTMLSRLLVRNHGKDSDLAAALGKERKEAVSVVLYAIGIAFAFIGRELGGEEGGRLGGMVGCVMFAVVAVMWFVPDTRIERVIAKRNE